MSTTFDLALALREVAESLVEHGVRSASPNPDEINLPGVWVQMTGLQTATLAGGMDLDLALYLVADFTAGHWRAVEALSGLLQQVTAVYPTNGRVVPVVAEFSDDTRLPAMAVPVQVTWTPTPNTVVRTV